MTLEELTNELNDRIWPKAAHNAEIDVIVISRDTDNRKGTIETITVNRKGTRIELEISI